MRTIRIFLMYVGLAIAFIPMLLAACLMPNDLVDTQGDTD